MITEWKPGDTKDPAVLIEFIQQQQRAGDQVATELGRLGRGIEKIAAKYGADHPEVAEALHRLLRGAQ